MELNRVWQLSMQREQHHAACANASTGYAAHASSAGSPDNALHSYQSG